MPGGNQTLDLEGCGQCACFNLRKATRAVTQMFDAALQPLSLRATQFTILAAVAQQEPIQITELAQRLVMDRTTLSRDLGPLEKQRWVRIEPGEDRRTRVVELTIHGRRLLEQALPAWKRTQEKVVNRLGSGDFEVLLKGLSATVSIAKDRDRTS